MKQGESTAREQEEARSTIALARQFLAAGSHRRALETLRPAYEERRRNGALKDAYIRAIEQIQREADAAYAGKRYAQAGILYDALLRDGFPAPDIAGELSFDKALVQGRIRASARALTRNGLAKYREGKIEAAIALWEKVLLFDRDNHEVKSALATAKTQRQNLERMQ